MVYLRIIQATDHMLRGTQTADITIKRVAKLDLKGELKND